MNAVDGSEHYDHYSDEPPPSLLTVVLDTNPFAWAKLADTLPLSKALANILVFIHAHVAFNYSNQVAVIASHCDRTRWLYPNDQARSRPRSKDDDDGDVEMTDDDPGRSKATSNGARILKSGSHGNGESKSITDANKYRPFRQVEDSVMANLQGLIASTSPDEVTRSGTTMMAGALTIALSYINRQLIAYDESNGGTTTISAGGEMADSRDAAATAAAAASEGKAKGLQCRVLIISVSNDVASQYIPMMNCIFAAQRKNIPIDVLKIASSSTFLQQASDATGGVYMHPDSPLGILQYLMMAFLPDQTARRHLVLPTHVNVDFRAACFCHKKVVDVGFVCSICLSIFCEPPPNAECLTCSTHLHLGHYGAKPALYPLKVGNQTKQKRKKAAAGGSGGGDNASGTIS